MRQSVNPLLIWVLVFSAFGKPAQGITIRHDRSDSQYTALASNSFPCGGILSGTWLGSGTLIAPSWVLTASHVLSGVSTFQTTAGTVGVAETVSHPSLDIGLARLASPITTIQPAKLYSLSLGVEDGKAAVILGAGATGTGLTGQIGGTAGTRRAAETYVYANASAWGWGSEKLLTWFRPPGGGAANLEGGGAQGDSGGGLLLNVNGQYAIAGVMTQVWWGGSGGDAIGKYNTGGVYVRSAPVNAWICSYATGAAVLRRPGDANDDGKVDNLDASILAHYWQKTSGATWAQGDFNGDGRVNDLDASILAANWQRAVGATVPEPATVVLLFSALLTLSVIGIRSRNQATLSRRSI